MSEKREFCYQTGKVSYRTAKDAYKCSDNLAKYTREKPRKVYKCRYCGDYHLTHTSKRASIRK